MAKKDNNPGKEPGRFKQLWQIFNLTRKTDKALVPVLLLTLTAPIVLGVLGAIYFSGGSILTLVLYIITALLLGTLLTLIVLGQRAERTAYQQISGQPGAVGAVLRSALRRAWQASEFPVAVNPKTQEAVYRAVGKPGVVLIAEGSPTRTKKMLEDERRAVLRAVPEIPIHFIQVGEETGETTLPKLNKKLNSLKKKLRKAEVLAVSSRLNSLQRSGNLPIPKGIDPNRVRAPRPR
jgi:fumarate reductase subunit D